MSILNFWDIKSGLTAPDGSASSPTYTFRSDGTTGAYLSSGVYHIGVSGNSILEVSASSTFLRNTSFDVRASQSGSDNNFILRNQSNTANSGASIQAIVAGTSGGNPYFVSSDGTNYWSWGMDKGNSNRFSISQNNSIGTNNFFLISLAGATTIGASGGTQTHTVNGNLTITGNANFNNYIVSTLLPNPSATYDLGSTGNRWNNLWLAGQVTATGGFTSSPASGTAPLDVTATAARGLVVRGTDDGSNGLIQIRPNNGNKGYLSWVEAGVAVRGFLGFENGSGTLYYRPSAETQAEAFSVDTNNNFVMNNAALLTSATDGFLYIATCAGAPSGTPTSFTGRVAMVYDTTDNKLYVYNGAWKSVTLS